MPPSKYNLASISQKIFSGSPKNQVFLTDRQYFAIDLSHSGIQQNSFFLSISASRIFSKSSIVISQTPTENTMVKLHLVSLLRFYFQCRKYPCNVAIWHTSIRHHQPHLQINFICVYIPTKLCDHFYFHSLNKCLELLAHPIGNKKNLALKKSPTMNATELCTAIDRPFALI